MKNTESDKDQRVSEIIAQLFSHSYVPRGDGNDWTGGTDQ